MGNKVNITGSNEGAFLGAPFGYSDEEIEAALAAAYVTLRANGDVEAAAKAAEDSLGTTRPSLLEVETWLGKKKVENNGH